MFEPQKQEPFYIQQPSQQQPIREGWALPILQSLTGGVLFAGIVGAGVTLAKVQVNPWQAAALVGLVFAFTEWLALKGRWAWRLERSLGLDLLPATKTDQNIPPETVRVEVVHPNGEDWIDLPSPEKLPQLAEGLVNGRTFSQAVWTGGAGIFTRSEFEALRSALLARGLAVYRNPQAPAQGIVLTAAGRAVMRKLLQDESNRQPTTRKITQPASKRGVRACVAVAAM